MIINNKKSHFIFTIMYQATFGTKEQISFNSEADYYEFLGFLAKNDGSSRLVWERNNEQGAWGPEGRIEFLRNPPAALQALLLHTAGNTNMVSRVNCNEFLENLLNDHNFEINSEQDETAIRFTVPANFNVDFDRGLNL
jgi:hypothetical protein